MMEVFQKLFKGLDNLYMIYGWCLNDENGKRTSQMRVGCLKLKMCNNGGFGGIRSLGCFRVE